MTSISLSHLRKALKSAQTALESWNQSAVQDAVAERLLSDFIGRCTKIEVEEAERSDERIHRFDGVACIQSRIVAPDGRSMRVFCFHPRDNVEHPFITETMYSCVRKKFGLKDGEEFYTTEDYPVHVVNKHNRVLRIIPQK
jgi:hypothetical protein